MDSTIAQNTQGESEGAEQVVFYVRQEIDQFVS